MTIQKSASHLRPPAAADAGDLPPGINFPAKSAAVPARLPPCISASAWGNFMVAHYHRQTWNGADLARALAVGESTVRRNLDLMTYPLGEGIEVVPLADCVAAK